MKKGNKRMLAYVLALVLMFSNFVGFDITTKAAGEAKGVDVLTFTVKNEKGNPVPGVKLEIYDGNTPTYKKLTSNALGMVRWTPELSDDVFAGRTLTVKPIGPETTDSPLTFEMEYIYSGVGRIEIKTINGEPAKADSNPVLVVKGGAAETQGNKKQLVVNVKDKKGNPVNDCAFVMKDEAFPDAVDGMAKYPSNGVVKFTLSDNMQFAGIIRVHSQSKETYTGNELTFTSKNREFLTVNGEAYDGIKEYTIVVTKKGEEPEVPEVNKAALEQKITDAKAIKNENYTEASWNALQAAITAAEAVRDNADATQDDVDAQVTALEEAINGLKVNTPQGNKKVLVVNVKDKEGNPVNECAFAIKDEAFPNAADGMAKYPVDGVVKFTLTDSSQLGGVIRVHSWSSADYEGTELTFTSKNKEFLTVNGEAYDGIKEYTIVVTKKGEEPEKPEVNKEVLKQKITDAKAIENKNYTEASWKALQAAITAAEAVRDDVDATQDDVDAQVTALETAVNGLEEKEPEVNKDELKKAIDAAKAIENKNYTEASWKALQAAITAAEAVRDDVDATQDDVDAQVTALETAVNGLKEKEPEKPEVVNKAELKKTIDAAKAVENKNYTEASWNALQKAIKAAEVVYENADATQDEVDAQVVALKNAVDGLKVNTEKPNPQKPGTEKPNTNKPNTNKPNVNGQNVDKNESATPKTGDTSPIIPSVAGMFCAIAVVVMILKKKEAVK